MSVDIGGKPHVKMCIRDRVKDEIRQGGSFNYRYDNIGNRKTVRELEEEVSHAANSLNQYLSLIHI